VISVQIGELDRTMAQKVSERLLPRMPNTLVRSGEIKEEDTPTAQNVLAEDIQTQKQPSKKVERKDVNENELNRAMEELNKHFQIFNTRLSFSFNDDNDMTVIKIQDRNSGEVIKQIPPQEMLDSLSKISNIVGILIDKMM
jgi:flagellar protein FlaG